MNATSCAAIACLALSTLVGCGGLVDSPVNRSEEQLRTANYFQAYAELDDAGVDPESEVYRRVELAYLVAAAQDAVFNNRELEAIEIYERVLEIAPDNETALQWRQKCRDKMAKRAVDRGDSARAAGDLREALLAYADAMRFIPDYEPAVEGRAEVAKVLSKRRARAQAHYYDGVRALGNQLWGQTWYHMVNAVEMDPELEKARKRRDDVARRLLRQRYDDANRLAATGHYGAALKACLELELENPDYDGLQDLIASMREEVAVQQMIQDAEMQVFRGEYVEARGTLEEALERTETEQARVSDLLILVRERDLDKRYDDARILELEGQLEAALVKFEAVAEEWPDFRDVGSVIDDLRTTVAAANEAYERGQKAEAEGDTKAAIAAYEDALLVYPGFKGLDARVAELKAAGGGD